MSAGASYRHLRVVVISPSDVATERHAVGPVLDELNRSLMHDRGLHLDGYFWEADTYAAFHPEGFQKGVVDPILKLSDANIVIAIFWTRLGTPSVDGKTGTQHELDTALAVRSAERHIAVYRSRQLVRPEVFESETATEQLTALNRYLNTLPSDGVVGHYEGPEAFPGTLRRDLVNYVRQQFPLPEWDGSERSQHTVESLGPEFSKFLAEYRGRFQAAHDKWDLGAAGVPEHGFKRPLTPDLEEMYLPLRFGNGYDLDQPEQGELLGAEQVLASDRRIALRGAAGSGKTTWMRFTFRRLLRQEVNALPVLIELRQLAKTWQTQSMPRKERSFVTELVPAIDE